MSPTTPPTSSQRDSMKKFIITGAALVALAVPAVASASVSVNDQGAGFVGKGDVQAALGLANDAATQDLFKKNGIKFTATYKMASESTWRCGDTTYSNSTATFWARPLSMTANTNSAGKLTNGWDISGVDSSYLSYSRSCEIFAGFCPNPAEQFVHGSLSTVNPNTLSGLKVNGVDLPNTPVL
jgi:hypothetical protein